MQVEKEPTLEEAIKNYDKIVNPVINEMLNYLTSKYNIKELEGKLDKKEVEDMRNGILHIKKDDKGRERFLVYTYYALMRGNPSELTHLLEC